MANISVSVKGSLGPTRIVLTRGRIRLIARLAVLLATSSLTLAQEVKLPVVNLGETSFEDGFGGPGWLIQEFPDAYYASNFRDNAGNKIPGSNTLTTFSTSSHSAYISSLRIFGAWLAGEVILPVARVELRSGGATYRASGLADLTCGPGLQWATIPLGDGVLACRSVFDVTVPTGNYNDKQPVNIGNHFVVFDPYYAITYEAGKIEYSVRLHYLWNSRNDDPSVEPGVQNTQAGEAFHVNYATSYEIWKDVRVGFNGYWLQQLTDDKINGSSVPYGLERTIGLGAGVQVRSKNIWYHLNVYQETDVRNRPCGFKVAARLTIVLPAEPSRV